MKNSPLILSVNLIILIFLLLLLGGLVHNTGSSLACPDWPLCYGQIMPPMEGGILIEHSHRLLASLVGFLTILLSIACYYYKRELFLVSLLALLMVIVQGLLGGMTVIMKLPTIVSTFHLTLSMIYFSTIIFIFHRLSFKVPVIFDKAKWDIKIKNWAHLALATTFIQIIWGAFLRHSGAGASCGLGYENSLLCLDQETWRLSFWPLSTPSQMHILHRYFALVVVFFNSVTFIKVLRSHTLNFRSKSLASFALITTILQVVLGILVVSLNIATIPTTLHLGVGALILVSLFLLNLDLIYTELSSFTKYQETFVSDLLSLAKPRLAALVMGTVFTGMLVAPGEVHFLHAIFYLLSISLLVVGATTLNCYMEKDVDGLMERTKDRPLPAGRLNPKFVFYYGIILTFLSLGLIYYLSNTLTTILGALASAFYLFAYTPLKKHSDIALYVGAIPGALPPLMGWTYVTGDMRGIGILLFCLLFIWQLPHFLAIAIYHARDYSSAKLKVLPNLRGEKLTVTLIILLSFLMIFVSGAPTYFNYAPASYGYTAVVLSAMLFLYSLRGLSALKEGESLTINVWAKHYFWGTIIYLPLVLGAMLILIR
jgi:heme o synthase